MDISALKMRAFKILSVYARSTFSFRTYKHIILCYIYLIPLDVHANVSYLLLSYYNSEYVAIIIIYILLNLAELIRLNYVFLGRF